MSEAGGRNPCAEVGEGATGAMNVGAGTEDRGGEADDLRGREEGGEEVVHGWAFGVVASPDAGGLTPWVAAEGGVVLAAALMVVRGSVLAMVGVSGGSEETALATESAGAGDCSAATEGPPGVAASVVGVAAAAGGSASGEVEDLACLPSEGDGILLSSTGLF